MKNVHIIVTDNRTITVVADTKRFGKGVIMFEGHTFMECCDYIRRTSGTNHFQLRGYSCARMYTDTEGRTMPWIMDVVFDK